MLVRLFTVITDNPSLKGDIRVCPVKEFNPVGIGVIYIEPGIVVCNKFINWRLSKWKTFYSYAYSSSRIS